MKVKDYVSVIKDEVNVNVVYDGKKITEFKAPYWDTIESDILGLEIREVKYPGKSIVIETQTGRPVIVSTIGELWAAFANNKIKFVKLGADISDIDETYLSEGIKVLDLAGHELSVTESHAAIVVVGEAALDIFDSEGGGLISGGDAVIAEGISTVNLHSGDYVGGLDSGPSTTILARDSAKVGIYGGYYANLYYNGDNNMVLETDDDASITCYGGKFKEQDPSDPSNYVAYSYQAVEIPDTDPVVYQVKSIL